MKFIPRTLPSFPKLTSACLGAATALALLAGCSHVPVMSIPALASIDFQTTQFSALRAAIEMPAVLVPNIDGVRLNVTLSIEGAVAEERSYALVGQDLASLQTDLPEASSDRHIFVYALSPEDQLGMDAIRRAVEAAKANDRSGSLAISVSVDEMCAAGSLPDGPLRVDVFLKTSETNRFVRTLDGFDLREISIDGLEEELPTC
ncbi:MAG: hypothetical protein ACE37E_05000 [Hyphomicrobiales bacterium]